MFKDRQYFNTSNAARLSEDAYTLWDARLVYRPPNNEWEAKLRVNNLTDEEYVVDIFDLSGSASSRCRWALLDGTGSR